MERSSPNMDRVHEQQGPSRWHRFRQWLGFGAIQAARQGEEQASVSTQNNEADDERYALVDKYVDEALARSREREKYEAGGAFGRVTPALVLGPQRYPDPRMWAGTEGPPRFDPEYQKAAQLVEDLDRITGFGESPAFRRPKP